jgi:hypothetical protein
MSAMLPLRRTATAATFVHCEIIFAPHKKRCVALRIEPDITDWTMLNGT